MRWYLPVCLQVHVVTQTSQVSTTPFDVVAAHNENTFSVAIPEVLECFSEEGPTRFPDVIAPKKAQVVGSTDVYAHEGYVFTITFGFLQYFVREIAYRLDEVEMSPNVLACVIVEGEGTGEVVACYDIRLCPDITVGRIIENTTNAVSD